MKMGIAKLINQLQHQSPNGSLQCQRAAGIKQRYPWCECFTFISLESPSVDHSYSRNTYYSYNRYCDHINSLGDEVAIHRESYINIIFDDVLGAVSIRKTVLPGMAIPMLKIRRPTGRLIFNMGIPIPGKTVFYIETGPRLLVVLGLPQPW